MVLFTCRTDALQERDEKCAEAERLRAELRAAGRELPDEVHACPLAARLKRVFLSSCA